MPFIHVMLTEGRSLDQKRDLIASFTRETVRAIGCNDSSVQIVITDVARTDWGSAGLNLEDKAAAKTTVAATPPAEPR
ncbi:tautomerase family protein [Azospirillum soli]|uniref:tautomerase family protein n=1 Tax=Azospirillum soli TaxID=1304799 RepID=UPI001AE21914|nr:tautomerase family protein [Azospirillum soli]MBP2316623.1 4-oxalocrotonate tautomerase [Azospirillum soli]